MATPQETERSDSPIAREIENFLAPEESWRDELREEIRRKISKRVRERYRLQIKSEIKEKTESEFKRTSREREREREEQKEKLKRRIYQGETTGDQAKDICFACLGRFDEEVESRIRTLGKRVEQALKVQENPLVLQIHFLRGEPNVWTIAMLEKPGLHLLPDEVGRSKFKLGITTKKGYANWGSLGGRFDYWKGPLSFLSFNLQLIEPEMSFRQAPLQKEKERMYIFLIGQEEIKSLLHEQGVYAPIVGELGEKLQVKLRQTEEIKKG